MKSLRMPIMYTDIIVNDKTLFVLAFTASEAL